MSWSTLRWKVSHALDIGPEQVLLMTKQCGKCKLIKDSSLFHKRAMISHGLQAICKPCCLVRDAQYLKDHPERLKAYRWKYCLNKRLKKFGFEPYSISSSECRALIDGMSPGCQRCDSVDKLHIDHIAPLQSAPELAFTASNLQYLCVPCHKVKTREDSSPPETT